MFGHQDNQQQNDAPAAPANDSFADNNPALSANVGGPAIDESAASDFIVADPAPSVTQVPSNDVSDSTVEPDEPEAPAPEPEAPAADVTPAPQAGNDELLSIKQSALAQLSPLVGHLEQSPEEKFRTTMMMIQASDNHELVKTAFEAAGQITDEKARAQALLDVVNEINYFTQHQGS